MRQRNTDEISSSSILIVEDSMTVQLKIVANLTECGITNVKYVSTLLEARDSYLKTPPDMIIIDLHLPDGEGLELLNELRSNTDFEEIPVLILTADDTEQNLSDGFDAGADDFLRKPWRKRELQARVTNLLEKLWSTRHRNTLIDQLQTALKEVHTLGQLIPICAVCKNIRDDKGYWQAVESYISDHSAASFSHAVCPDCFKKVYPDIYEKYSSTVDKLATHKDEEESE